MRYAWMMAVLACLLAGKASAEPSSDDIKSLGVGIWCYQLHGQSTDALKMADKASEYGIGSVRLKAHDGTKVFRDEPQVPSVAEAMHARGIKVLIWGFNYASQVDAEAAIIIGYLEKPWCDGYVFDTEGPLVNHPEATEELVTIVRAHRDNCPVCQNKLLGFAPYAFPSLHRGLNYRALVMNTDFIEPQMYWATMGRSVEDCINRTYHEWLAFEKANGISKPIIPLGQAYDPRSDNSDNRLEDGEIEEFGKRTRGYLAVSYYVWPTRPEWWREIRKVSQGRGKEWQEVAQDPRPLPHATAERPWYARWWTFWIGMYEPVVILFLVISLAFVTRLAHEKERQRFALLLTILTLAWPWLLAAALVISAIGVAWIIAYAARIGLNRFVPRVRK